MPIVEVPGIGDVEFPDTMGDDEIAAAIKKNMAPQKPDSEFKRMLGLSDQQSAADYWKRTAGLTARTLTEWSTDIPTMLADIPVNIANSLGGNIPTFSGSREAFLNKAYQAPAGNAEKLINVASRGALGAGSIASAANKSAPILEGTAQRVMQQMAARPTLQTVSGATGAGSSEFARQKGAGPLGQAAAGFAGAMAPVLLSPRVPVQPSAREVAAMRDQMDAMAQASGSANVSPGSASAQATLTATPTMQARGGGYNFGSVGDDPSASLTPSQVRITNRGQALGMRMTPGQATGSRALQQFEAKLESQPMTSGPFNTLKANNAQTLNRQAAASIGEASNVVDDVVLARARDRIGDVYASVADDTARSIDPDATLGFLSGVESDTRGLVKGLANHPLVDDVLKAAGEGQATGRQLQNIASKLGKSANQQMTSPQGDRELGIALFRVKDYVDDLLAQGLSSQKAQQFAEARQQYRNLMLLTQRVGVVNPSSGNVNGRSLANLLQAKDKPGYLYGRNQSGMYDAARFSQAFPPIVGDSGTATRMPLQGVTDFLLRVPMSMASRAYVSSPSVNMMLNAQAATRALRNYPTGLFTPFTPVDMPTAGLFGTYGTEK